MPLPRSVLQQKLEGYSANDLLDILLSPTYCAEMQRIVAIHTKQGQGVTTRQEVLLRAQVGALIEALDSAQAERDVMESRRNEEAA